MADEKNNIEHEQSAEETPVEANPPVEEAAAETRAEEPAAEAGEAPAAEPEAEQVPEGEPVAETTAEEEAAAEAEVAEPAAEPGEPQAAPERKKRKRLPRRLRRQRSKARREAPAERKPITRLPKPEGERGRRQERRGVVVSTGMDKTIVVRVDTVKAHPRYKKIVRRSKNLHVHDAENRANVGDVVRVVETRPLSKTKHWRLAEVVEEAK